MISIRFTQKARKNFTPAWKITDFCNANGIKYFDRFGTTYICYCGGFYTYDHYTITPAGDLEHVEIFLKLAEREA